VPATLLREGRSQRGRPTTTVAHALFDPKRRHSHLAFCRKHQNPTAKYKPLLLLGAHHRRRASTLCERFGGQAESLPQPPPLHREPTGVPQRTSLGVRFYQGVRTSHIPQVRPPATRCGTRDTMALPLRPPTSPPSGATPDTTLARTAIPKNLTLRFGAQRASVYGSSVAAKLAPFAAAAKEPVREAHARDFRQHPI
jgi:hypothetical protein